MAKSKKVAKIPEVPESRFNQIAIWHATRLSVLAWMQKLDAEEIAGKLRHLSRKPYVMDLEVTHADLMAFVSGSQDKRLHEVLPNQTKRANAAIALTLGSVLENMRDSVVPPTKRQVSTSLAELKRMVSESDVKYGEACVFVGRMIGKAVIIRLLGYN